MSILSPPLRCRSVPRITEALRWHLAGDPHEFAAALSDVDREHITAIGQGLVAILNGLQERAVR